MQIASPTLGSYYSGCHYVLRGKMSKIELFGFPTSPYVLKVAAYLGFKHLEYEFIGVNPLNYQELSFAKVRQVPVIRSGDEWCFDSDQIALWLEQRFPERPLLPQE